jgi:hypothetical protein
LRDLIGSLEVIGEGRRGPGNIILGVPGDIPDMVSPLAGVIAYGMLETTLDVFSITVREEAGRQVDVEIVSRRGGEIPEHFEEKRRWTYSLWGPGMPSPDAGGTVREIRLDSRTVLALASGERRIWVWEGTGETVRLVPITGFSDGVMQARDVRDPATALRSSLLFERLGEYTDEDLRRGFARYNALHPKVALAPVPEVHHRRGWRGMIARWFRKAG